MTKPLVEFRDRFEGLQLIREQNNAGQMVYKFRGPFQEMNDVRGNKNRNGRRYTKELWERVFADDDVLERLRTRRMLGELDHPADQGQIRRTAVIVTKLTPNYETGIIEGELELLNHNQGDAALVRALADQGVMLCVSSRSYGDYLEDGCTIDPKTFKLITFDIVLDPSVSIAQLNRIAESVNRDLSLQGDARARVGFIDRVAKNENVTKQPITDNKEIDMEELKQLMKENADHRVKLATLETNMGHMESLLKNKNESLAALEAKIDSLSKAVTESEVKIRETEKLVTEANAKVVAAEAKVTESETKIKELTAKVSEYEQLEDRAVKHIEAKNAKIKEYEALGEKAADRIEALEKELEEAKKAKKGKKGKNEAEGDEEGKQDDEDEKKKKDDAAMPQPKREDGEEGEEGSEDGDEDENGEDGDEEGKEDDDIDFDLSVTEALGKAAAGVKVNG